MQEINKIVWVSDAKNVFELATLHQATTLTQAASKSHVTVRIYDTEVVRAVPCSNVYEYDESHSKKFSNLAKLNKLNEPAVLQTIHSRYDNDHIYTYIQPLLISVNPFKPIANLYDISYYTSLPEEHRLAHIYYCAEQCLRSPTNINHSILVSGESGAGKTQGCKKLLNYFVNYSAHAHNNSSDCTQVNMSIEEQLVACNAILESFGNAQTIHNHNSSRYGKYLRLWLQGDAICSAEITHYLLEKTRVVRQSSSERSYHIFYQLLHSIEKFPCDKAFALDCNIEWNYLPQWKRYSNEKLHEVDEVISALTTMKLMDANIFSLLTIILHLGNISFVHTSDGSAIVESQHSQCVSRFLAVDNLNQLLCYKMIQSSNRTSMYYVGLSVEQAASGRDALAKDLYSMLFGYLMRQCNASIQGQGKTTDDTRYVGILDIFGFEVYDTNFFEQFCINYCNEKLHQVFIHNIFSAERQLIESEGGDGSNITYFDNAHCLQLIDGDSGLIKLVDEMCILGRSDDLLMLSSFQKQHSRHPCFKRTQNNFEITHFAATVTYSVTGFIICNTDRVSSELEAHLINSKSAFIASLYAHRSNHNKTATSPRKKQVNHTIIAKFNRNLKSLIEELQSTKIQFIRCIKPNSQQVSSKFHRPLVYQQLKYSGILDIIHVRKASYPLRQRWEEVHTILKELDLYSNMGVRGNLNGVVEGIKQIFRAALTPADWFEGNLSSLVYMKHDIFYKLQCYKTTYNAGLVYRYWNAHRLRQNAHVVACRIRLLRQQIYKFSRYVRFRNKHRRTLSAFKKLLWYFHSWRRRRLQKKISSADVLISFLRRFRIRCIISHVKHMQSKISAAYRGHYQRKRYIRLRTATICLQRHTRGYLCYAYWHPLIENIMYKKLMAKHKVKLRQMYSAFRNYYWRKCTQEILRAVRWGEVDGLRHLLQKFHYSTIISVQEIINMRDRQGGYASLLHLAVAGGHVEIVEWLLHMGCDPLQTDIIGQSPLHRLPISNVKSPHAKVLGILLLSCPRALYEADRHDTHRLNLEKYQKEPFASMIIKGERLADIIETAMKLRQRSVSKAKHKEALRRGSTVALELLPEPVRDMIMDTWEKEHNQPPPITVEAENSHSSGGVTQRTHTPSFIQSLHAAHDLTSDPKLHRRHGSFTLTPTTLPPTSSRNVPETLRNGKNEATSDSAIPAADCETPLPSSTSKLLFQQHVSKTLQQLQGLLNNPLTSVEVLQQQSTLDTTHAATAPNSKRRGSVITNSDHSLSTKLDSHAVSPARRRVSTILPSAELSSSEKLSDWTERTGNNGVVASLSRRRGSVLAPQTNATHNTPLQHKPLFSTVSDDDSSSSSMHITSSTPFGSVATTPKHVDTRVVERNGTQLSQVSSLTCTPTEPKSRHVKYSTPNSTTPKLTPASRNSSRVFTARSNPIQNKNVEIKFHLAEYRKLQEPTYSKYDAMMQHIGQEKPKTPCKSTTKEENKRKYELYVAKQQSSSKDPVLNFLINREAISKKK